MNPKTKFITRTALFAAVIALLSPFAIPLGPVPITLSLFAVLLSAVVLDWKQAAAQLRTDPDTMQRMAESPDGQALMALMQQQNGSQLQKAMEQGEGASAAEMAALLKTVLSSGEGRTLLQRLSQQLK